LGRTVGTSLLVCSFAAIITYTIAAYILFLFALGIAEFGSGSESGLAWRKVECLSFFSKGP